MSPFPDEDPPVSDALRDEGRGRAAPGRPSDDARVAGPGGPGRVLRRRRAGQRRLPGRPGHRRLDLRLERRAAAVSTAASTMLDWSAVFPVGPAIWGAAWSLVFGFSFATLRLSTLVLGLVGCGALYLILRELEASPRVALLGALSVAANPVFFLLSSSFMTDVPFVALTLLALLCYVRAHRRGEVRLLWWGGMLGLPQLPRSADRRADAGGRAAAADPPPDARILTSAGRRRAGGDVGGDGRRGARVRRSGFTRPARWSSSSIGCRGCSGAGRGPTSPTTSTSGAAMAFYALPALIAHGGGARNGQGRAALLALAVLAAVMPAVHRRDSGAAAAQQHLDDARARGRPAAHRRGLAGAESAVDRIAAARHRAGGLGVAVVAVVRRGDPGRAGPARRRRRRHGGGG